MFGYIITRIWLQPVLKYRRLKRRVEKAFASDAVLGDPDNESQRAKEVEAEYRKLSVALDSCHFEMPPWYRIMLKKRGEDPEAAAKHLGKLADTRNVKHAENRVEEIKKALHLK